MKVFSLGKILILFLIFLIVGCGSSERITDISSSGGTSQSGGREALPSPNISPTPPNVVVAPGVDVNFIFPSSVKEKSRVSEGIPLPAGYEAIVKSVFAEAVATNIFGYYDPITGAKITLTSDTLYSVSIGEVFPPIGPFDKDVTLSFWFYSRWINAPGALAQDIVDTF